jgi:hypothetical protein
MINQINIQEVLKKNFINIFEISHLFDVSGITARRHINGILKEIELLKDKIKLDTQGDNALLIQELNTLLGKVRRRVIGQTKMGEDIFILELAKEEALAKWELRPDVQEAQNPTAQNPEIEPDQLSNQEPDQKRDQDNTQKTEKQNFQEVIIGDYGSKYVSLLESQLTEKDDTIKDLRETNKFLSITNGKLNEQLKLLLERPQEPDQMPDKK